MLSVSNFRVSGQGPVLCPHCAHCSSDNRPTRLVTPFWFPGSNSPPWLLKCQVYSSSWAVLQLLHILQTISHFPSTWILQGRHFHFNTTWIFQKRPQSTAFLFQNFHPTLQRGCKKRGGKPTTMTIVKIQRRENFYRSKNN